MPAGFDWNLWLGPSLDRPYHPNYTHTNFRGWYEIGGGVMADMGHYSLWPIFPTPRAGLSDHRRIDAQPRLHGFGRYLPGGNQERLTRSRPPARFA